MREVIQYAAIQGTQLSGQQLGAAHTANVLVIHGAASVDQDIAGRLQVHESVKSVRVEVCCPSTREHSADCLWQWGGFRAPPTECTYPSNASAKPITTGANPQCLKSPPGSSSCGNM